MGGLKEFSICLESTTMTACVRDLHSSEICVSRPHSEAEINWSDILLSSLSFASFGENIIKIYRNDPPRHDKKFSCSSTGM